jgi:hypothetical protein
MNKRELDIEVVIELTNKCEKMCKHCYRGSHIKGESMPFSTLKKIMTNVSEYSGVIGFTGGEPVLYEDGEHDFIDVANLCKELKLQPSIMLGGVFDTKQYRRLFDNMEGFYFNVSFNLFRDHWEELFVNAVKFVQKKNQVATVLSVYNSENELETKEQFRRIKNKYNLHVPAPHYGEITFMGRATSMAPKNIRTSLTCELQGQRDYLLFGVEGNVLPCCAVIPPSYLYDQGWPKLDHSEDLLSVWRKSREFCCKTCRFNKYNENNKTKTN